MGESVKTANARAIYAHPGIVEDGKQGADPERRFGNAANQSAVRAGDKDCPFVI